MIKYKGITTLEVLEEAVNYNKWIASEIKPFITYPTLEIGSGTGNLSHYFFTNKSITLSDTDQGLVDRLKKKFQLNKSVQVTLIDITKRTKSNKKYSSVFAVNVLEHIKDDKLALRNIFHLLSPRGRIVLLVPAKKFAFTALDTSLGHYRRYEKEEIISKVEESGFKIEKVFYFNIVGLVSWKMRAVVEKDNHNLKSYQVRLFDKIVPFLKFIEQRARPPLGISLVVVAQK